MRVFIVCVFVVGATLAHRWEGDGGRNNGAGGRFDSGDDNNGRDDDVSANRLKGPYKAYIRKRQATFPSDPVVDIVKETLGKAYTGISADDLKIAAQSLKAVSEALLAANNADVSDEEAQSVIDEVAAKVNGVPAIESIDSDELGDQAHKVTLILQLWKGLAEKVKSLEGLGQNYDASLKVLSKLSDSLLKAVSKSVDYVSLNLLYRDLNKKADKSKRQDEDGGGDWSSNASFDYSPDSGATVGAGLTYSNGPLKAGAEVQYNTNTGAGGKLDLGYKGDGYEIGGNVGYSQSGGPSVGVFGKWEWK